MQIFFEYNVVLKLKAIFRWRLGSIGQDVVPLKLQLSRTQEKKKTKRCSFQLAPTLLRRGWAKTFALLDSIHAKADWVRCPLLPLCCRHCSMCPLSSTPSPSGVAPGHEANCNCLIAQTLTACTHCVCPISTRFNFFLLYRFFIY